MSKKKAYVIGTNVSTSLSPAIFQYWFNKYNIDAEYGYIEIKEENFDKEIKIILKEEGLVGLNITIPYKEKISPYLEVGPPQRGWIINDVVNCVTIESATPIPPRFKKLHDDVVSAGKKPVLEWGKLGSNISGDNTDVEGFKAALYGSKSAHIFQKTKKSCCAIVLGYGGAAKSIIYSLMNDLNFKHIIVFNRTFDKIKKLKENFVFNTVEVKKLEDLPKHIKKAQLIVNTTPANMLAGQKNQDINPSCIGFDIVYRPREGTGFLKYFKKEYRIEGIHMLVHQAAPCFKEWFGVEPETEDAGLFKTLFNKMNEK